MNNKAFSQAAENNKQPILEVIRQYIKGNEKILEIGSGTGQHAVFFAEQFPNILWQTSDLKKNHDGIYAWIQSSKQSNILQPLNLDVNSRADWPNTIYDIVFTANTTHIMSWHEVTLMIELASKVLKMFGYLIIYGPFNQNGQYTSNSNKSFDAYLKAQNDTMGIRDIIDLQSLANRYQFILTRKVDMPVNNKILIFTIEK